MPQAHAPASYKDAPRRGAGGAQSEQVVLLEFKEPQLRQGMQGMDAAWRSAKVPSVQHSEVSSPRLHRFLTVKFTSFDVAVLYTVALKGACYDRAGNLVDRIHKGATARESTVGQPMWRGIGASLRPVAEGAAAGRDWSRATTSNDRGAPASTRYFAVKEDAGAMWELATIAWQDAGDRATLLGAKSFAKGGDQGGQGQGARLHPVARCRWR